MKRGHCGRNGREAEKDQKTFENRYADLLQRGHPNLRVWVSFNTGVQVLAIAAALIHISPGKLNCKKPDEWYIRHFVIKPLKYLVPDLLHVSHPVFQEGHYRSV
jgi:hypothetical protein